MCANAPFMLIAYLHWPKLALKSPLLHVPLSLLRAASDAKWNNIASAPLKARRPTRASYNLRRRPLVRSHQVHIPLTTEKGRQAERGEVETGRQTDKQTNRQPHKQTDTHKHRHTDSQSDTLTPSQRHPQTQTPTLTHSLTHSRTLTRLASPTHPGTCAVQDCEQSAEAARIVIAVTCWPGQAQYHLCQLISLQFTPQHTAAAPSTSSATRTPSAPNQQQRRTW